ncbi:MAG: hypothetical protein B7Z66_00740 [Chromatiales bacterium 21-64-14]|nr:MAG: hypothetical protein B7Z66_00740 [Chromatiales bacterium 21-64-14]HQU15558.1 DUF3501 family protein [Gammaproteobacteria bacterium]
MQKLTREDLYALERYAELRPGFRAQVIEHKRHRQVALGPSLALLFEDRLTIQYQIQEMLRVERIFEVAGIQDELDAYNPLIPDGANWKATMMVEFPDEDERRRQLARLVGIEDRVWVRVSGFEPVYAVADEDMERATEEKTSAVHFLRFELDAPMVAAIKGGAALAIGVAHEHYDHTVDPVPGSVHAALVRDLA